jgi:hypothetical protein
MPDYVAYMFAPSAARFPRGVEVRIEGPPGAHSSQSIGLRSSFLDPPHEVLARGLLIEARGHGNSLESATDGLLGLGGEFLPALCLTANAFVDEVRLVAAYDVSTRVASRDWLQRYPDPEPAVPPNSREVPRDDFGALLTSLAPHPERDRVGLAIAYYREAIRHWKPGSELLAVVQLQIAAETITPVAVSRLLNERGLTRDQLAAELGYDPPKGPRDRFIASRVRLQEIYRGDNDLRRGVERASNGYEHGLETFAQAKQTAELVRDQAAHLIRTALLREAGVGGDDFARLTADRYRVPLRLTPAQHFWRGKLAVNDDHMLTPGTGPITMRDWVISLRASEITPDGSLRVQEDHVTGNSPEGTTITFESKTTIIPVGIAPGGTIPTVRMSQPRPVDVSASVHREVVFDLPQDQSPETDGHTPSG